MNNDALVYDLDKLPFILVKEGTVTEISEQFINITQFTRDEFLNNNIEDIFKILRFGPNASINSIDERTDYFLFSKSLEVKFINIKLVDNGREKIFIFSENHSSNLDVKFPFISKLCSDNYYGIAIFSLPDITLLKANETFISFFDSPFNHKKNCIGKHVSEFVTGFEGSTSEKIWQRIVETGETYNIEEYRFDHFERGITYWKSSLTPIYEEGKLKYCIEMTTDITEQVLQRKNIEEQSKIIKQQNKKLRWQASLLNLSSEAIFAWNLKGDIIYWNKGAEQLYGYSKEEAIGCISDNLLKSVLPFNVEELEAMLKKDGVWRGIVEHTGKDGTNLIISTTMQIITVENGQQIVLETNRDVTEVKRMEDEIKQQKDELEEIIQNIDDAIYIYDGNKNFYLINDAGNKLFYNGDYRNFNELNKSTPYKYYDVNGDEITEDNLVVSRVSRGEVVVNYKMTFKSNSKIEHYSVNGRPVYDKHENIKFVVISCRNITNDVEKQKLIERQKELFEVVIHTMQESIDVIDNNGHLIITNRLLKESSPTTFDTIKESYNSPKIYNSKGKKLDIKELPIYSVLRGETVKQQVYHHILNGKDSYAVTSGTPIFDEQRNIRYAVLSTLDITDIMKSEKALKEAQRKLFILEQEKRVDLEKTLEMKDEFLSLISHEFRTPLNVINTAIQAINYFCINELPEKAKKYLDMIRLNTFRQLRLVNNLLDITRANAGRIKTNKKNLDIVFLSKAITESVQVYASQKGIKLEFKSSFKKRIIGIDDEKYERILLNLLSNAIKFTPNGKSITVKLTSKKNNICIEVKDEGIGIPKDKLNIIFQRFGQVDSSLSRQAEGTGIGLSLVKKFAEALDGSISAKSTVEKGSAFTLLLPDETVNEEINKNEMTDLMDNRLVYVTNVEFSDIYI